MIHALARRLDPPRPKQRLEAQHHPGAVLDQIEIQPRQLLERGPVRTAVIHRAQAAASQPLGELVGIDLVALVPRLPLPPPIAHHHPIDQGHQQIVQPLGLRAFLKGDVDRAAHAAEELHDRRRLRRQDGPGDQPPGVLPDGCDGGCLMHVQRHMFGGAFHESRSLLRSMAIRHLHGSSKGRALNMR
jgi:hypothetical protein